jgi:probable HAF family extracellular repeat protein
VAFVLLASSTWASAQKQHAFIWNSGTGMTDLGTLGGDNSYALGINDSGQVVGYSYLADNFTYHSFIWTAAGGMVDVGSTPDGFYSQGTAINAAGDITGFTILGTGRQVPFYRSHDGSSASLAATPGDQRNYGFAINDSSQVTGQRYDAAEIVHALIWRPLTGRLSYVPPLAGAAHTVGTGINNLGHITGTASIPSNNGIFHAMYWSSQRGTIDIGSVAGQTYTAGQSINESDEIAGFGGNAQVAFYWSRGTHMILLQTLGGTQSAAFSINQGSAIAGYSSTSGGAIHAALWPNKSSAPEDLGTLPGGSNSYGRGVNNSGQVVGYADAL